MGAPQEYWKYGDFSYLLEELTPNDEEKVPCEGCGWLTHKHTVKHFISHELEIVRKEKY